MFCVIEKGQVEQQGNEAEPLMSNSPSHRLSEAGRCHRLKYERSEAGDTTPPCLRSAPCQTPAGSGFWRNPSQQVLHATQPHALTELLYACANMVAEGKGELRSRDYSSTRR